MQDGPFCHRKACIISGDNEITVECPLCKENVFCSQACKIEHRGLFDHLETYCDKKRTVYTPRSVLTNVVAAIQKSDAAKEDLYEKYKKGENEHGPGALYLVIQDTETICSMLHSCITDIGIMISSLAVYTPLDKLTPPLGELKKIITDEHDTTTAERYFILSIHAERQGSVIHKILL